MNMLESNVFTMLSRNLKLDLGLAQSLCNSAIASLQLLSNLGNCLGPSKWKIAHNLNPKV